MTVWSRIGRRLGSGHLADDELLELLIPASLPSGPSSPPSIETQSSEARDHLNQCDLCGNRSIKLQTFLNGLGETNETSLDQAFPVGRLATQRERIMRRLRRSVQPARPGRVLSFPALTRPAFAGIHSARRWLAVAAVAGLVAGIGVGQFLHFHPEPAVALEDTDVSMARVETAPATRVQRQPSTASFTDPAVGTEDAFLDELEMMLSSPQVPVLSPLDEITPRIREVAVNVW